VFINPGSNGSKLVVNSDASFNGSKLVVNSDASFNGNVIFYGDVDFEQNDDNNLVTMFKRKVAFTGNTEFYNIVDFKDNVTFEKNVTVVENGTFKNITVTGTFTNNSDYRIKSNVVSLDSTNFSIDNLNPVFYFNENSKKNDIGFIAHELQDYFPFLVNGEKDGGEMQSVNYIGLIGMLVHEIQTLKKKVENIENSMNIV
jgi:hypothetical protein